MSATTATARCVTPRALDDALRALRDEPGLTPIAGCTDALVDLHLGRAASFDALNLWRLDELRRIDVRGGRLVIGALATHARLRRDPLVRARLPILAEAAATIGGPQVQARGTLGGNVMNASPAGDTLPVLLAAGAVAVLASVAGERRVPFDDFYTAYRATVRRPDELLVALEIPAVDGPQRFRKVGTRAASAISKVVIAAVLGDRPRVAAGSVAPTVVRLPTAEAALHAGADPDTAASAAARDIAPIDDVRSTAAYRRRVVENVLRRILRETR